MVGILLSEQVTVPSRVLSLATTRRAGGVGEAGGVEERGETVGGGVVERVVEGVESAGLELAK